MSILKDKLYKSVDIIEDIINNSDYKKLFDYCNKKKKLPTFIFSGVGKNWYICEKEVKTFLSMGINAKSLDCTHALHGDLGMLMDKDEDKLLIFVSKSGTTKEMVQLLHIIKDLNYKRIIQKIKIACVFLKHNPELHNLYDFVLTPVNSNPDDTNIEVDQRNLIPSLSIHETQMVLDILGVQLYEECDDLIENYQYNHLGGSNGKKLGMDKYLSGMV